MENFNVESIAKGYVEMAEINLSIVEEYFYLEDEAMKIGENIYDLEEENTEGNAL